MNFALMNCGTFQAIFISLVNATGLKPYPVYTLISSSHTFFRLAESVLIPPIRILVTNSGRYATFQMAVIQIVHQEIGISSNLVALIIETTFHHHLALDIAGWIQWQRAITSPVAILIPLLIASYIPWSGLEINFT